MSFLKSSFYPLKILLTCQFLLIIVYQCSTLACDILSKIKFDISQIDRQGLIGSENGQRSLAYEFCIPAEDEKIAEVKAIAPTINYYRSPGRIRCRADEVLCIVSTHHPQWLKILLNIAQLPYVEKIEETFWE